jgi:hypothetical protein
VCAATLWQGRSLCGSSGISKTDDQSILRPALGISHPSQRNPIMLRIGPLSCATVCIRICMQEVSVWIGITLYVPTTRALVRWNRFRSVTRPPNSHDCALRINYAKNSALIISSTCRDLSALRDGSKVKLKMEGGVVLISSDTSSHCFGSHSVLIHWMSDAMHHYGINCRMHCAKRRSIHCNYPRALLVIYDSLFIGPVYTLH